MEAEKAKYGDDFDITDSTAKYLEHLAHNIKEGDSDTGFSLPGSFDQFNPETWPPNEKIPHFVVHNRKEIYEEAKRRRVTAHGWRDMEGRFKALPRDVRADYSVITPDDKSKPVITAWHIVGGEAGAHEAGSLCGLAGTMLLRSPAVARTLSASVRTTNDPVDRRLEFLRETYGIRNSSYGSGNHFGETHTSWDGRYDDLPAICARACIDNEAKEI